MKRLIVVGSPRVEGRSAHLAEALFETNIEEHPEDELFLVPVSEIDVGPCIGCNGCREKSPVILKGTDGEECSVDKHRCVFDDDMQTLYDLIDDADELTVVSPVYFSGAPSSLKCLLDRLQPYYWARAADAAQHPADAPGKRPATLHVVGEGGDPHGYDALVSEVKSALAVAGFRLERVLDWVGKIDTDGEIVAEADERILAGLRAGSEGEAPRAAGDRPKLDLSAGRAQAGAPAEKRENRQKPGKAPTKGARKSQRGGQGKGSQRGGRRG